MKILTILMIIIYNIVFIYSVLRKKNIFCLGTIINLSVNFNFILYLFKWSYYIIEEPQIETYMLINSIVIIFIIVMLLSKTPLNYLANNNDNLRFKNIKFHTKNLDAYTILNIVYILLFFIENYIGSKSFIPNLVGIDIHTYSAPLISFITRSLYVMLFINYIAYNSFKKKRYIIFMIINILLFPIFRGARLNTFISIFQFIIFLSMYNFSYIVKNKSKIVKYVVAGILVIIIGISVGNDRLVNQQAGVSPSNTMEYSDFIKYSGPRDRLDLISWYYGYFPMSFFNLDNTIKYIEENNIQTYGLYTIRPITVGFLQFDNIIPGYIDMEYANSITQYKTKSATVSTGFKEFYMDFGVFSFISIGIYAFIGLALYNSIQKNIFYLSMYACYAGSWFFMAFQNVLIDPINWYSFVYLFLIYNIFIQRTYSSNNRAFIEA